MTSAASQHRISWYVYTGGTDANGRPEKIRRTASMRGAWPGYDVTCSCGWETKTGGAVRSYVEQEVWGHKFQHNALDTEGAAKRQAKRDAELAALHAELAALLAED